MARVSDLEHDDPVAFQVQSWRDWAWRGVKAIGGNKRVPAKVRLAAYREVLKRTDPEPAHTQISAELNGPLVIRWQSESSPSPTSLAPSNGNSTTPSNGNSHALPASSATDDLGNL